MTVRLRAMSREAADAIPAVDPPHDVRVARDHPTEFSVGVASYLGAVGQFGPFLVHRSDDDVVVGEIGGAFVDERLVPAPVTRRTSLPRGGHGGPGPYSHTAP